MTTLQSYRRRLVLRELVGGGACCLIGQQAAAVPAGTDPLGRAAVAAPRALSALLLGIAAAGPRLVAVGERGTVLLSDDAGVTWRQAACPVSVTLTAVTFVTPQSGWAVGHAGVVLHTLDGGSTWTVQLDGKRAAQLEMEAARAAAGGPRLKRAELLVKDGADKPLLDLHFDAQGQRGFAVGAFGLAFTTVDGGATWRSAMGAFDNPKSLHLNAIRAAGGSFYLAGEQGLLLRSSDGGEHFSRLESPYAGSWFALGGLGDEVLIAAGLKGNAWWSADRGASFAQCAVPVPVSFASAAQTRDNQLLLVNHAGMVFTSSDRGKSFRPLPVPPGPPVTAVVQATDGGLVATTMKGALRLQSNPR